MLSLVCLIPIVPLAGFLLLALAGSRLSRTMVALVGVGSVGLAALLALVVGVSFFGVPPAGQSYHQVLWTWMRVGNFAPAIAFHLDPLSLLMVLVVTVVGFLIHLYSTEYMADDEGFSRFFAYMNLFVSSMLILVLADNLLLLYLGWEGVGLCSYLLIGFWYKEPANCRAAMKAFIVTRIGDTGLAVGLFLLWSQLGTLQIQQLMSRASQQWTPGSGLAVAAALLLLAGAVGKSAQLPLQTWLPDAMAGPTPVSALIHAATMVTAGVYLIARTHVLFALAPSVQLAVGVIGAATLLLGGFSALAQWDIKRVLAYSTISQIGYMFLALGVGAWSAAMFHFMTHAFFKSLLFLGAGVVIVSLHEEHDLRKMGGLRRELPVTFWTFLIGGASLSAVPLVTAGFYSKDQILAAAWASPSGGTWLWFAGLIGALLTSLYTFRLIFLTFFGPVQQMPAKKPGLRMEIPLIVLAALSVVGGFVELPRILGNLPLFSRFLHSVFGGAAAEVPLGTEAPLQLFVAAVSLLGIYLAYENFLRSPHRGEGLVRSRLGSALDRFWLAGWGFDWAYDRLFVRPFVRLAQLNRDDFIDLFYRSIASLCDLLHRLLSRSQTGRLRWYAMGIAVGAVCLVALVVFR